MAPAGAKPARLLDPGREGEAYRDVLAPWGVDVPGCLAAGRDWLLLEAVDGVPLWQAGELGTWEAAARWLGDLHGRGAPSAAGRLLRYDAAHLADRLARAATAAAPGALAPVGAVWDVAVERLLAWPRALVHGDFYPSNVLVSATGSGAPRIRPVDWELAGIGPGLLDLAALTSGAWTPLERRRLAAAYHGAWRPPAGRASLAELVAALEAARLVVAVGWLGWSPGWIPPPEHAQDWLAAALDAAERIGT